ncbi:MAG: MBL fold metallo-hydrolase [Dehalococcoidia bacterium]|nr:MBL fold metallo-hydrolase [Dehalococcoidia bacterium]
MTQPGRQRAQGADLIAEMAATGLGQGMVALWNLGQASIAIKGNRMVYVDPFLSGHLEAMMVREGRPMPRLWQPPLQPTDVTNADLVLITHDHADHLDPGTLPALAAASPAAQFVVPASGRSVLDRLGIAAERAIVAEGDQVLTPDGVRITPVPAAHYELDPSRYLGYVIEMNQVRIYHPGDTVLYDGLLARLQQLAVDIALLPINGRDWFREQQDIIGNLSYREAADLGVAIGADLIIPIHYGMFAANTVRVAHFVDHLNDHYPEQRFHILVRNERFIYVS